VGARLLDQTPRSWNTAWTSRWLDCRSRPAAGRQAAASVVMLAILTVALGFGYPAVVTLISRGIFPSQSAGSLVYSHGKLAGPALLGQPFTDAKGNPVPRYFQPRPSAVAYNGAGSGASNLGPTNPELITTITKRLRAYRAFNHLAAAVPVPVDAVTAVLAPLLGCYLAATFSGSGKAPGDRVFRPAERLVYRGVIVIVGGLIYFPMLILGPIGERITG